MNYDAFAGRFTNESTLSERQSRAVQYHEGAVATVVSPYPKPSPDYDTWHRGLYDGFVRREENYSGGSREAYRAGFRAGAAR
jgi:hypothetical protein